MNTLRTPLLALILDAMAASAMPTAAIANSIATPLIVETVADIQPFASADGSTHLVYELLLVNQSAFAVTVGSLTVLDDDGDAMVAIDGVELAAISRLSLIAGSVAVLQPSQSSFVFLDVAVAAGGALPKSVTHRFVTSQAAPTQEGSIDLGGLRVAPDTGVARNMTFTTAPVSVGAAAAIVLQPPLRGEGWVTFRSCCDVMSSHRGNTGIYDGAVRIAERFAIDFVRLDANGHMVSGPGNEVGSYVYYGEEVYAVADGVVVSARNDQPTQMPGTLSANISDDASGGNSVVIDIGSGHFAFYAHMQPQSVRVKPGDAVKAGDIIGLLGNSGKTMGPHLHFHVTDTPSPMDSDGLPFVFAAFEGEGVLTPEALGIAMQGQLVPVETEAFAGHHRNVMPVNSQKIGFGP